MSSRDSKPSDATVSHQTRHRAWTPDARALDLVGDAWVLPILRELVGGPLRLTELYRRLPGLSRSALSARLKMLSLARIVERRRFSELPPRVEFTLLPAGEDLLNNVLPSLVSWSMLWCWGPPEPHEYLDIPSLLRLVPYIVAAPSDVAATVVCSVTDASSHGCPAASLRIADGSIAVSTSRVEPTAHVRGTSHDWANALTLPPLRRCLTIDGDQAAAELILDGLAAANVATRESERGRQGPHISPN